MGAAAGMTMEAALVVPLFWCGLSVFLYLFLIFRLQEDISQALADAGRELSQYVYSLDGEEDSLLVDAGLLRVRQTLYRHCKDQAALRLVEGGVSGIRLWESSLMNEDGKIELVATYDLRLPWMWLGMGTVKSVQKQVCRGWIGYTGGCNDAVKLVYVTPFGERYHESINCRYLRLSVQCVSGQEVVGERNEDGEIYHVCQRCCSGSADALVYITEHGNRYHESLDCPGLKRTVYMVRLLDVEGKSLCAGCGGGS